MAILDRLSRATNSRHFIPEVDGFRFFSIVIVMLMHLNVCFGRTLGYDYLTGQNIFGSFGYFITRGGLGVQVFFAISGFIVSMPFLRYYLQQSDSIPCRTLVAKPSLGGYFLRRLTRLQPPFIIAITFFFIVHIFLKQMPMNELWKHYAATMIYSHCFIYGQWSPINPVTWSLETEVQFYIIAPFLCAFIFSYCKKRYSPAVICTISIGAMLCAYFLRDGYEALHLTSSIFQQIQFFLVGVLVAFIYLTNPEFLRKKSIYYDMLGIASMLMLFYFAFGRFISDLGFILFLFLLFISIFKGKYLNKFFTSKFVYTVGGMCYSIYLLHYPSFYLICKLTRHLAVFNSYVANYFVQVIVVFPIVLVISTLFYYYIERPCMDKNWPKKLAAKWAGLVSYKKA